MKSDNATIHLLLADDHVLMRQGVAALLNAEPDMEVVAQAGNAREALAACRQHRPDVTLMDLRLPELECVGAIEAIVAEFPHARILILTDYEGAEDIYRAMKAGARGYLLKSASPDELRETVRAVHAGLKRIAPEMAIRLAERSLVGELTETERAVLREMAKGQSNQQIADALTVTEGTVKFHVNNILLKLDAANRTEAVLIALKRGLVRLPE